MKIIHSFWSSPFFGNDNFLLARSLGGWEHKRFFYASAALSCLQFKKYYGNISLVTDKVGKKILIDLLQLPYDDVIVELDQLNRYNRSLWALGKVHAYGLQTEPFIHVDNDVFIWSRFPERIETAKLISQNVEVVYSPYRYMLNIVKNKFSYIPPFLDDHFKKKSKLLAYNAGIIGGRDYLFFEYYRKEIFRFIDRNKAIINSTKNGLLNIVFEQFFYYLLAREKETPVECLFSSMKDNFDGLADFETVPVKTSYIHAIAVFKKVFPVYENMCNHLHEYHTDYYYRLDSLLNKNVL